MKPMALFDFTFRDTIQLDVSIRLLVFQQMLSSLFFSIYFFFSLSLSFFLSLSPPLLPSSSPLHIYPPITCRLNWGGIFNFGCLQSAVFWKDLNLQSPRFSKSVEKWPSNRVKFLKTSQKGVLQLKFPLESRWINVGWGVLG